MKLSFVEKRPIRRKVVVEAQQRGEVEFRRSSRPVRLSPYLVPGRGRAHEGCRSVESIVKSGHEDCKGIGIETRAGIDFGAAVHDTITKS